MKNKIKYLLICIFLVFFVGVSNIAQKVDTIRAKKEIHPDKLGIIEGYPMDLIEIYKKVQKTKPQKNHTSIKKRGVRPEWITRENREKAWAAGQTVTISFKGGNSELHKNIADAAIEWTKYGNLSFDFGFDPNTNQYREWKSSDTEYTSDIRISFEGSGYWSVIGKDSINPEIRKTWQASMNLQGFTSELPEDYYVIVLHEFGHAVGFEHEHRNSNAECKFNWGKIYDYFKEKHKWGTERVYFNLSVLPKKGNSFSGHDKHSIMHYDYRHLKEWMFVDGKESNCYIAHQNVVLSEMDKAGMSILYPNSSPSDYEIE